MITTKDILFLIDTLDETFHTTPIILCNDDGGTLTEAEIMSLILDFVKQLLHKLESTKGIGGAK